MVSRARVKETWTGAFASKTDQPRVPSRRPPVPHFESKERTQSQVALNGPRSSGKFRVDEDVQRFMLSETLRPETGRRNGERFPPGASAVVDEVKGENPPASRE